MSMQLGFFVDPTCLWSWLTLPIAGPGRPPAGPGRPVAQPQLPPAAPRRHPGAPGPDGGHPHRIPPGGAGDGGPAPRSPRRRPPLLRGAAAPGVCRRQRRWATVHGSWKAPWWPQSYPSHATAADDATFDGPIRGSVAPAFAAAGGGGGGLRRWCCTRIRRLASLGRCRATNWGRCATAVGCGGSPGGRARCPGGVASPPATI
jgi:hypothetical protein